MCCQGYEWFNLCVNQHALHFPFLLTLGPWKGHTLPYNTLLKVSQFYNEMVAGLFTTSLLSLLLPITALAGPHLAGPFSNRHHDLARRVEGNVQLYQRGPDSRWSYYNAETGSA